MITLGLLNETRAPKRLAFCLITTLRSFRCPREHYMTTRLRRHDPQPMKSVRETSRERNKKYARIELRVIAYVYRKHRNDSADGSRRDDRPLNPRERVYRRGREQKTNKQTNVL